MLDVVFGKQRSEPLSVLCLGAHCDDIEIGCGGTILSLAESCPRLSVRWVVLSSTEKRAAEARGCAESFLRKVPDARIHIERFNDGYFPYEGSSIKDYFEELKATISPDLIFTHYRDDWHQDHRLVCDLTWNTWRNHLVLEYEIPKYDPDLGSPNLFVKIDEQLAETKVRLLLDHYESQRSRHWFTRDLFLGVMRTRGIQACAERYAEAFYCRKCVLSAT